MNADAIRRVEIHFRSIKPLSEELVTEFYSDLFTSRPDLRTLFPSHMAEQHRKLGEALSLVVASLRNQEHLASTLRELGQRHVSYGVTDDQYDIVRDSLISALSRVSGQTWSEQLRSDWSSAIGEVITLMAHGEVRG